MDIDMNLTLQQQQSLSQSQIQSLRILAFDSMELNRFLRDEYLENPLLDYTETHPDITRSEPISFYKNVSSYSGNSSLNTLDIPQAENASVRQYLIQQLDLAHCSKSKQHMIDYLIDCLDDNGYFRFTPEEIAQETGADVHIIHDCLDLLKTLEPAGIFAFDLKDCLISQLDDTSDNFEIMTTMISNHLEDMASGKISSISRALGLSTAEVRKCIDRIRLLNPKPLSGFLPGKEEYVIPDIVFTKENGDWNIALNDRWTANYHLNDYYVKMMKTATDPELLDYFEGKLKSVQFIFSCIEQRRKTLLSVAEAILNEQNDFFSGTGSLHPMTMSSLSEKLGIHPSTFSRAVKGKYVQYPGGSILFKNLFTTSVTTAGDEEAKSQSDVKSLIKKIIDTENKSKPYSDQTIVKLLKEQNIYISRRAVTKYRLELGIGSSVERKE